MQCFFFISRAVQMQYLACWYKQHFTQCAGPENIHNPPTEGTGIKEMYEPFVGISRGVGRWGGGGALRKKSLLWARYAYFMELHNT